MEIKSKKEQKIQKLVSMLEGKSEPRGKTSLELAKLNLMKKDPGFNISKELFFINRGEFKFALVKFIDVNFILPRLLWLIDKFISSKK